MIKGEIRSLTGLRAIAATWVVLFHVVSGRKVTFYSVFPWADEWFRPLISAGQLGVDLFFVLSGYVLTLALLRQRGPVSPITWAARRTLRLLPPVAASVLLSAGLC